MQVATPPSTWVQAALPNPEERITLYFALAQENVGILRETALAVSDIHDARYGENASVKVSHEI